MKRTRDYLATIAAAGLAGATLSSAEIARTDLPLKQAVLFTSGVAYFERAAEISGTAQAELAFKTEQINDLIKSLVLIDEGGGKITVVSYEPRDPLERTLKSFSVDLSDNPDLGTLLNRLRGVSVRVKASPRDLTGAIIGVETRQRHVDKETFEEKLLKLMSDNNVRTLALDTIQEIEVLDPVIQADLASALKALAASHDQGKKKVRLTFSGERRRRVRAGYMLEAPVWKTSYRLVLDKKDEPLLQGWAHIENMTDEDWIGITLTLVSGRPLSFIQNLYEPIYLHRPVVQAALDEAMAPPEYEGGIGGPAEDAVAPAALAAGEMKLAGKLARGLMAESRLDAIRAGKHPDLSGMAKVEAMAAAREAGELFQYAVKDPITLPRRQSAMIVIVNQAVKGEKLSIFNAQVNPKNPLNGLELENTSGNFLMQGPVAVFEDGMYAGDARLTDTARGEKRLIAYALDLAGEGKLERKSEPDEIVSLKIVRGTLTLKRKYVSTALYALKNKREKERRYLIEHPLRSDWELVEPAKGIEKTRDAYRFSVALEGGKSREIPFREQRLSPEILILANIPSEQVRFFISQKNISGKVRQALEKLVELQTALEAVRKERQQKEQRLATITGEQNRIRENMKTVTRNSESYAMWERKLVQQEQELDQLHLALEKLRADEQERSAAIARFLAELNVE